MPWALGAGIGAGVRAERNQYSGFAQRDVLLERGGRRAAGEEREGGEDVKVRGGYVP